MGFICSGCFTQAQSETQYGIVIEKQLFTVWHTKSRQYILWAIRITISIITLPKAPEGSLLPQQAFPLVSTGKSAPPPRSSLGQAVSAAKLPPTRSINTDGTDGLTWLSGQLFPTILTQLTGLHFYLFIYIFTPFKSSFVYWWFLPWILDSVSTVPSLPVIFTFLISLQTFSQLFLSSLSRS